MGKGQAAASDRMKGISAHRWGRRGEMRAGEAVTEVRGLPQQQAKKIEKRRVQRGSRDTGYSTVATGGKSQGAG